MWRKGSPPTFGGKYKLIQPLRIKTEIPLKLGINYRMLPLFIDFTVVLGWGGKSQILAIPLTFMLLAQSSFTHTHKKMIHEF